MQIYKIYFPNVSPFTDFSVECFNNNISSYLYKTNWNAKFTISMLICKNKTCNCLLSRSLKVIYNVNRFKNIYIYIQTLIILPVQPFIKSPECFCISNASTYFLSPSFTILACKIFHFIVGDLHFL